MPTGRDDEERTPRKSGSGRARPDRSGAGRPRTDRARKADPRRGEGSRGDGPRGSSRSSDRDSRGRDSRGRDDDRGPRPPIKGKRRTFDVDSAPNARERDRAEQAPSDGEAPREGERWIDEGPVRDAADRAVRRGRASSQDDRPRRSTGKPAGRATDKSTGAPGRGRKGAARNDDKSADRNAPRRRQRAAKRAEGALELDRARLNRQLGTAKADRVVQRLGEASDAFAEDRYEDARRILKPLADTVPSEPAIRELHGISLYRLGKWAKAVTELEEFVRLTQSTEQHPVLADCHRALGNHGRVEELWEDLAAASPAAALVAEGRIVYSGSLADQGRLADAISVLEAGSLGSNKLKDHHLRMRYALGDLYDRAGEQQAARRHFEAVAASDAAFFDVTARLRQL